MPPSGLLEGLTVFSENTGLVVGRTLVDPSAWKVPVLVSNFGQETVMVEPFSETGMIGQVTAIQAVMDLPSVRLPEHLRELLTCGTYYRHWRQFAYPLCSEKNVTTEN